MSENSKPPVLVVLQLSGGNDFMNTLVPYNNPHYYDARKTIVIPEEDVLPINDTLGFNPNLASFKELYEDGDLAVVQGIGYPNSSRSHFRAMDIWHTCEPDIVATEGWVGKAIRELDPAKNNVLTGVNFGRGLPRAMAAPGVPVTSVNDLDNYGLLTGIDSKDDRKAALDIFKSMYGPAMGSGPVMDYLAQTGEDVLRGSDQLKTVPANYHSDVEYGNSAIAGSLRDVARVHLADLGTRIFYTSQGGYDNHATQMPDHPKLLQDLSRAVMDFFQDIRDAGRSEEVIMLIFTEFGRRMRDNGSGTDHGSGGGAFIIGDRVNGGLYSEYPSIDPADWLYGEDLKHTIDFRGIYGTVLEQWLGVEAAPVVGGSFEQITPFSN